MGERNTKNGGKNRQQNEEKKVMPIQNSMSFKGKNIEII